MERCEERTGEAVDGEGGAPDGCGVSVVRVLCGGEVRGSVWMKGEVTRFTVEGVAAIRMLIQTQNSKFYRFSKNSLPFSVHRPAVYFETATLRAQDRNGNFTFCALKRRTIPEIVSQTAHLPHVRERGKMQVSTNSPGFVTVRERGGRCSAAITPIYLIEFSISDITGCSNLGPLGHDSLKSCQCF